jgi:hypothetical protein
MPAEGKVPHDDHQSGYVVGFQAVRGVNPVILPAPLAPPTIKDFTPFLMGVREGIRTAGGNVKG